METLNIIIVHTTPSSMKSSNLILLLLIWYYLEFRDVGAFSSAPLLHPLQRQVVQLHFQSEVYLFDYLFNQELTRLFIDKLTLTSFFVHLLINLHSSHVIVCFLFSSLVIVFSVNSYSSNSRINLVIYLLSYFHRLLSH